MPVVTPSPSQEVPVNIRFCLEGMEESGSEGLDALIFAQKDQFFKDVDFVCISDNYWLGKNKPCVTYGLRGICYFFIEVREAPPPTHTCPSLLFPHLPGSTGWRAGAKGQVHRLGAGMVLVCSLEQLGEVMCPPAQGAEPHASFPELKCAHQPLSSHPSTEEPGHCPGRRGQRAGRKGQAAEPVLSSIDGDGDPGQQGHWWCWAVCDTLTAIGCPTGRASCRCSSGFLNTQPGGQKSEPSRAWA